MELDSELVESARKGHRPAAVQLLAIYYPIIWRMSAGLTGRDDVARGVVKFMMQRSLRMMPGWKDAAAPTRWFHHHTILTIRRTQKHQPDPQRDTLLGHGAEQGYVAFIRALRALPMQQREAFILFQGEKMGMRECAVAMDCSVGAAENHFREASERMRTLAGEEYTGYVARLHETYQTLAPAEEIAIQDVRRRVRGYYVPRLIWRTIKLLLALALMAGSLWAGYWLWQVVHHSME